MSLSLRAVLVVFLSFFSNLSNATSVLPSGWSLNPGQTITSPNGQYVLIMQGDGNLVYYRKADSAVRWHTGAWGAPGSYLIMQSDGNAATYFTQPVTPPKKGDPILYKPITNPIITTWYSATTGNPGAHMEAKDNGDLVVALNGRALWSIGPDPDLIKDEPKNTGDIVGRTLASFIAFPGHVGFYDGSKIYHVMNEPQVVQQVTVDTFKAPVITQGPTAYWGAGYPQIPLFWVKACFEADCTGNSGIVWDSRSAMKFRAQQIRALGAKYTLSTDLVRAFPRTATTAAQAGTYRCDTYVLDIYALFNAGHPTDIMGNQLQVQPPGYSRWADFRKYTLTQTIIPTVVFQLLKNYRG